MNLDDHAVSRRHSPMREERRANPLFARHEMKKRSAWKMRTYLVLGVLGVVAACIASTRVFRIQAVVIDGNHFLDATKIERVVSDYTNEVTAKVFRRSSYSFFSSWGAEQAVRKAFADDPRLSRVTIQKIFPFLVRVTIEERVPNLVYTNGGQEYLLDRSGIITALAPDAKDIKKDYPRLLDQTTQLFNTGDRAISSAMEDFIFRIRDELMTKTDFGIDFFYLRQAKCLAIPNPLEKPMEQIGETNINAVQRNTDTNENADENRNLTENSNNKNNAQEDIGANTNSLSSNTNSESRGVVSQESCDLRETVLASKEVRLKTTGGWDIYFRINDSPENQIVRLSRVLREQHLNRDQLQYVDLRFGDQVIYK